MDKDWLIRTATNQILGPVTKKKVKDLIDKKMISHEDEFASGNGFWFYYREQIFVQKYIYSDEKQPFDPISDIKSAINRRKSPIKAKCSSVAKEKKTGGFSISLDKGVKKGNQADVDEDSLVATPESSDLEFPEAITSCSVDSVGDEPELASTEVVNPVEDDLDYPDVEERRSDGPQVFEYPMDNDLDFPDMEQPTAEVDNDTAEVVDTVNAKELEPEREKGFSFELETSVPDELDYSHDDKEGFNYPEDDDLEAPSTRDEDISQSLESASPNEEDSDEDKDSDEEGILPADDDLEFPEL